MLDPIRFTRRRLLEAGAAGLAASLARLPAATAPAADVIRRENARPGTTDWQLTFVRTRDHRSE